MKVITPEELESMFWTVYRRGVIHGGMVAVATATVWLVWR
jgi:hypothetical protein